MKARLKETGPDKLDKYFLMIIQVLIINFQLFPNAYQSIQLFTRHFILSILLKPYSHPILIPRPVTYA